MKSFKEYLAEAKQDKTGTTNWQHPDDKSIEHEYNIEVRLHQKHLLKHFPTLDHFKHAVKNAKVVHVTPENDSFGGRSHTRDFDELHSLISGYASYPQYRNKQTLTIHKRKVGIERATKRLAGINEEKESNSRLQLIDNFISFVQESLGIEELPTIEFDTNVANAKEKRTMATYNPNENHIWLYEGTRTMADLLRSLAHEMVHHRQNEEGRLYEGAGEAGTDIENEANSLAGVMLRNYGQLNQDIYESTEV